MAFEYTPEWYGGEYVDNWINTIHDKDSLLANYNRQVKYRDRFYYWFKNVMPVQGNVMEYGFNDGKSMYWLNNMFGHINFYTMDWSTKLDSIIPYIKEVVDELKEVQYYDCTAGIKADDSFFDCVLSIDFFEHLPNVVYNTVIKETYRILKPGGHAYVYIGKTVQPEHINLIGDSVVMVDMMKGGFIPAGMIDYHGDKLLIFKKV